MKNKKNKIGRNDPCPCGSGLKYKKCCQRKQALAKQDNIALKYKQKYDIRLKTDRDIEGIKKAGVLALQTLDLVESEIRPGITSDYINTIAHEFTLKNNALPAPLNYPGGVKRNQLFPKSICVSINEVICHGIPDSRILKDGDIVNVDVTPILNGYFADANKTFFVGNPGPDALKIVKIAKECLKIGMSAVSPKNTLGDLGWTIQQYAESQGCSVVEEFVGHGVGFEFHEPPQILHYGKRRQGIPMVPGMVFTIEPMINLGKKDLHILNDEWTAVTNDGSLSAQFEQTVLVTENGFESLTPYEL